MQFETIHTTETAEVVEKTMNGETTYIVNEEQSNAFGVQTTQVDFFENENDALELAEEI